MKPTAAVTLALAGFAGAPIVPGLHGAAVPPSTNDFFSRGVAARLEIEIPAEGMEVLRHYRQVWRQERPPRIDVRATVREGGQVYTNVAVHLKGSFTFQPVDGKPSLTLNFDKFAEGQRFHGLDKIHLNNSVQDPSYLAEKLSRELFLAAGVPAARVGHARVSLNGRDAGFYVLIEGYNKRFLKRHFRSVKGNLYDGGSGGDITKPLEVDSGEHPEDRSALEALVAATRERDPVRRLARLEQVLDVDRFLTFAALEVLLQHWDGYCLGPNNFRLFHDRARDRMVFLPHGLDQILGVGLSVPVSLTPTWDGAVARALFSTPAGRRRYLDRLGEVFTNHFRAAALATRVDQMAEQIRPQAAEGLLGKFQYYRAVENLKARLYRREAEVLEQLTNAPTPLVFAPRGEARLTEWRFRQTGREAARGRHHRTDDRDVLEVEAAGGEWTSGSWRQTVFLEAGRYEFSGLGRVAGLPAGATNSGVMLRVSGERAAAGLATETEWTPLRYEFDLQGLMEMELICEFRGPSGSGSFDRASLKLRRLDRPDLDDPATALP